MKTPQDSKLDTMLAAMGMLVFVEIGSFITFLVEEVKAGRSEDIEVWVISWLINLI